MYVVKENGDGTVTIDRKVYEELHRRACAERTEYVPLTPDIRAAMNDDVGRIIAELDKCEPTFFTELSRVAVTGIRNCINDLPDGYPVQIKVK